MPTLGTVVIFIELLVMHWYFNPVLNASMMVARAAMKVYMFHSHEFRTPVMSSFFSPHQPFDNITLDDICLYFPPPGYPIDGESDFDTWLTPTVSLDSNPSKSSYPTYFVGSYRSEPSEPFVICMSSYSSSTTPGLWLWVHPHSRYTPWTWACMRRRTWG